MPYKKKKKVAGFFEGRFPLDGKKMTFRLSFSPPSKFLSCFKCFRCFLTFLMHCFHQEKDFFSPSLTCALLVLVK